MKKLHFTAGHNPGVLHLLPSLILASGTVRCDCGCEDEKPAVSLSLTWMGLTGSVIWA